MGHFGQHDIFRFPGDACLQCDVAAVSAHDLHDCNAVVREHGIPDFGDLANNAVDGRVKADGVIRVSQIVVDGAGQANRGHAQVVQSLCALEAAVAANDDQAVNAEFMEHVHGLFLPFRRFHFQAARGFENGSAFIDDKFNLLAADFGQAAADQAGIAPEHAHRRDAFGFCSPHNSVDGGIHSGGVSAACQNRNSLHVTHSPDLKN